ncbi:MAG: metallophosphoesterase [Thaumarchaeota archaeon]|nr:metallophosphoesterase [Candidatus Geocrenenecus arthurdayi]MCL7401979.1 metallophosphoesterase [Candidatus Geocrenenecus arthurdayi]
MESRGMDSFKIFFMADIHNSEIVFRRFLSIPKYYDVDVLILSGDLTGKAIIPIIDLGGERYQYTFKGKTEIIEGCERLKDALIELRNRGLYTHICTEDELEELKNKPDEVDKLFKKLISETIQEWVRSIEEIIPKEKDVILMPGNDDILEIDPIIQKSDRVIYPLNRLVELPLGYGMISMDYVNPTPWNTPRESEEKNLWKMLEEKTGLVDREWGKIICSFHPPPYNTKLDLAPKLDRNLRPVYSFGELEKENVGSKSVRRFFEKYNPLIGLHGHIHESPGYDKVGKTIVFNPGSEYSAGILKGVILELDRDGLKNWYRIG